MANKKQVKTKQKSVVDKVILRKNSISMLLINLQDCARARGKVELCDKVPQNR